MTRADCARPVAQALRKAGAADVRIEEAIVVDKRVAEAGTGLLPGASAIADGAGDVIQAAVLAIDQRLTVGRLASVWGPYLTTAERSSSPLRPSTATSPRSHATPHRAR